MARLQLRIALSLAALVVVVLSVTSVIAERGLRTRELEAIDRSLQQAAGLLREQLSERDLSTDDAVALTKLATAAGRATGARVTLIGADGAVVADSELPVNELDDVENHGSRPEVRQALAEGVGRNTRFSDTLKRSMTYLALPMPGEGPRGSVRVAVNLGRVDDATRALQREILIAGALGLVVALVLSYILSWFTLAPIEQLREVVSDIADGKLHRRLRWSRGTQLGDIATSINSMAEQLRERLDEATSEKARLEAVLASMVEGVLVLDERGRILLANPRLREILSAWGELEGRAPLEVLRHADLDRALSAARASEDPIVREIEVGTPEARRLLVHATHFGAPDASSGIVAVFHDVTEIRRLERIRQEFIASASHELRTPLTSIRGFADTLLTNPMEQEQMRPYLEVVMRNALRLGNLIDDLLELSRIESREVPLELGEVDVSALGRMLARDLGPRVAESGLELETALEPGATAWADRDALEQVMTNLLENAIRYTDAGGRITLRVSREPRATRISVEDTGIGIPEADRARIFERFYRVDKARSRQMGGTGLGLAIVKHLVQSMGGTVRVDSEVGKGSRFSFSIPHRPSEPDAGGRAPHVST